jgi:hypothetical protein
MQNPIGGARWWSQVDGEAENHRLPHHQQAGTNVQPSAVDQSLVGLQARFGDVGR